MLDTGQLERIHEASLHVLEKTGVVFTDEIVVEALAAAGCRADGRRVYMPPRVVERAIVSAPPSFPIHARSPDRDLGIGTGRMTVANAAGSANIVDDGVVRELTVEDVADWVRLCHLSANVEMLGYLVAPGAAVRGDGFLQSVFASVTLTDKPIALPVNEPQRLGVALDLQEIIFGADWPQRPRLIGILNPLSPLVFGRDACMTARALACRRQPVGVTPCPMSGTTGPATVAGMLVLEHAESLAGLALVQTLQPGCPFLYGGFATSSRMTTGDVVAGTPEFWGAAAKTVELGKHLGLPVRAGGGVTDSHQLDMQAGIETSMGLALVIERGVDLIMHGGGALYSLGAVSFEKLVIDDEIVGVLRRVPWDPFLSDETLAVDVIDAVGPGGTFLSHKHTRRHYRDWHRPSLYGLRPRETGLSIAAHDIAEVAGARVAELLGGYEPPPMDGDVLRQLERYCDCRLSDLKGRRNGR